MGIFPVNLNLFWPSYCYLVKSVLLNIVQNTVGSVDFLAAFALWKQSPDQGKVDCNLVLVSIS